MFTARMVDRKLRWEWLKRGRPFPFDILDKIGHKRFAEEHGADAAATLAVVDCEEIRSDARWLRARLPNLPPSFVLKPASGYQNRHVFAVRDGHELLRGESFDADAAAAAIARDGEFSTYLIEELLEDDPRLRERPIRRLHGGAAGGGDGGAGAGVGSWAAGTAAAAADLPAGPSLPIDFKFWTFGSTIAHVTVMCSRWRASAAGYTVGVADCDASFAPQPTWCTQPTDAASGLVELVELPPRPHCWDEMVDTARRLGDAVGAFARIDFYATPRGPVFGEFQLLFDLVDWNANADAAVRAHWRGRDGAGR